MKKFLVLLAFAFFAPSLIFAQTSGQSSFPDLQKQIQDLLKQVQALQQQIATLQAELGKSPENTTSPAIGTSTAVTAPETVAAKTEIAPPELTRSLSRGSSGDDVRKLQEFLAKDKEIYPEGLQTGFFGPSTEAAVKRWQKKQGIAIVGIVGPKTISKFKELGKGVVQGLLEQGAGASGIIPPGLLNAPGIQKKLEISAAAISPTATATPTVATTTITTFMAATTTPVMATTTLSGTIPAVPAQSIGQTGNTTVSATSAVPAQTPTITSTATTTTLWSQTATSSTPAQSATTTSPGGVQPAAPTGLVIDKGSTLHLNPPGINYSTRFNYTLASDTKSFRIYLKRPNSADFTAYTYDAQVPPLLNPSQWTESTASPFLRRTDDSSWFWWPADDFLPGANPSRFGEYKIYVTALNTTGLESAPSEIKSIRIYAPPLILSPTDGSTVSTKPVITFVTGDSSVSNQNYAVYVYKANGTIAWSYGLASTNFVYPGTELNPSDNPHRLLVHSSAAAPNFPQWSSSFSQVTFSVSIPPTLPQVQGLTATISGSSVGLSWQDVTGTYSLSGSPSNMFGSYNIYRGLSAGFTPSPIPSNPTNLIVQSSALSYTDSNLSAGTYYYKIALQDKNGVVGPASSAVSAVVAGLPTSTNTQTATTSSLNLRTQNLATISRTLKSVKALLEGLLKSLK